ncbi:MAG: hypothetical protein KatS3mg062_0279 [Tepidiforma sp.]|nr:MAG: hypothetical protein KatS3mg062_0279 [Tepidiforma sp.]
MSGHRISPPRVETSVSRAPKPPAELAGSANAFRQTGFLLGEDVELVLEGLRLEAGHAESASGAKFRNRVAAAVFGPWSRGWLARLQALHAAEWGDYSSAAVLTRAAADFEAAAVAHLRDGAAEWSAWLDNGGLREAHEHHATEFRLHQFRSAETLAASPGLGVVYREASEFALPHIGVTALLTASESNAERYRATFADRDFHLGLAELVLGWLLRLGLAHAEYFAEAGPSLPPMPAETGPWAERAARAIDRRDRCRLETVEVGGESRTLVVNWRREPRSPARRVLL